MSIARTSWVAEAFIAEVTVASDHLPLCSRRFRLSFRRLTRAAEPLPPQLSSAAPKPWAAMLFQLTIVPFTGVCLGSTPWMWAEAGSKPCHS